MHPHALRPSTPAARLPRRVPSLSHAVRALRAVRLLALFVCSAVLTVLGACAPDAPTALRAIPGAPAHLLIPAPGYTQVSAGFTHSCALMSDGSLACWGSNSDGQASPPASIRYTQVSAATLYTCAVTSAGALACWGINDQGQASPPAGTGYTQVSASQYHTCAVTSAGALACWGDNSYGQASVPAGLSGVTQVSVGTYHTCALTSAGALACWGRTYEGQASPPAGTGYTQVSAGAYHTCALTAAGAVTCWGDNGYASAPAGTGYTQVSAGAYHTCALTGAGTVTCWGDNTYGQWTPPAGLSGVAQISAGQYHTCAVTTAGAVTCWGDNTYGQSTPPTPPATHVLPTAALTAPTSVVAGQSFTLALGSAQVPGHPEATQFTYAFDCGDGQGYAAPSSTATASCPTTTAGPRAVRGKVIDQDGDTASYSATVTVTKVAQTVAFASAPPSPAYVGTTYAARATATSGLAATLTSLTPATCGVSGGAVTFAAEGACTLAADQAGNATYAAAPRATQTITVVKRPQAITLTATLPASAVVTSTFTLAATGGESGTPVVFTTQTPATCTTSSANGSTTLTLIAAGACAVQATQMGTTTYAPAAPVALGVTVLTPAQATTQLRAAVAGSGIAADVRTGLTDKLDAVSASLAAGQTGAACSQLGAFTSLVQAQRGKAIPAGTADLWLAQAAQTRRALGC